MIGYIYKFTVIPTSLFYVGMHVAPQFDEKYWGSGKVWKNILKYYGKKNILREVLCYCDTYEELCDKEQYWISKLDATNSEIGYNLSPGGANFWLDQHHTDETKKIIGLAAKDRKWIHNSEGKLLFIKNIELDKYLNDGWLLGSGIKSNLDIEARYKISVKNKGRVRYTNGIDNIFIPKELITEYELKGYVPGVTKKTTISTMWITNGVNNKVIEKCNFEEYTLNGWRKGRTMTFSEKGLASLREYGKISHGKKIKCNELDIVFDSKKDVIKYFNLKENSNLSHVYECIRGERKKYLGYTWSWGE